MPSPSSSTLTGSAQAEAGALTVADSAPSGAVKTVSICGNQGCPLAHGHLGLCAIDLSATGPRSRAAPAPAAPDPRTQPVTEVGGSRKLPVGQGKKPGGAVPARTGTHMGATLAGGEGASGAAIKRELPGGAAVTIEAGSSSSSGALVGPVPASSEGHGPSSGPMTVAEKPPKDKCEQCPACTREQAGCPISHTNPPPAPILWLPMAAPSQECCS